MLLGFHLVLFRFLCSFIFHEHIIIKDQYFFLQPLYKVKTITAKYKTNLQHVPSIYRGTCSDLPLTPGHAHVGTYLEAGVDVDDCAPHHVAGKMSGDELHGGCQVVSGLVALLRVVVCAVRGRYEGIETIKGLIALNEVSVCSDSPSEVLIRCL